MKVSNAQPKREIEPVWPISGAPEHVHWNEREASNVSYLQKDSFVRPDVQPFWFAEGFFSCWTRYDDLSLFLTWSSSSGGAVVSRRFDRLANIVRSIESQVVPEASDELRELLDRASQLRTAEPGTDEEIEEWATRLAEQVINADD